MSTLTYRVVQHDGGWSYRVRDAFSETYPTEEQAKRAAEIAAQAHRETGAREPVQHKDEDGRWHKAIPTEDDRLMRGLESEREPEEHRDVR